MPKECPMCGETMESTTAERADRVPGTTEAHNRQVREWICPECDYFEEATDDET